MIDIPNERSSHSHPIPRGGGLAIVIITLAGAIIVLSHNQAVTWGPVLAYVTGAIIIAAVSWLDDIRSLPAGIRLLAQGFGAVVIVVGVSYWTTITIPFFGQVSLGWFGLPITILWIAGLTNAYNFMDGIDGIAGSQAVVAGLCWSAIGWLVGQPVVLSLGLLLAASSLGFLFHNWSPARIFMGDVGSAFLGYTFAALPLLLTAYAGERSSTTALAGVLLVWPFVFDTLFTFLQRMYRGENVFAAHRSHLYQRLVIAGYPHRTVTCLYIILALTGAIAACMWFLQLPSSNIVVVFVIPLICIGLWVFVVRREYRQNMQQPLQSPVFIGDSQ
jgi:UDP-N-acetylmuramyl pentapeptide phosphotransferase/UDP-N-acetylglucosamine-1-phosphate transferase